MGPRALALAAELKVDGALPFGKLSRLFANTFGISITPGGVCQGLQRLGRATEPTYEALKGEVRNAACVTPDETGWRVGGVSAWLWVYVTSLVTVYVVEPGRGFDQAAKVLGEDFSGNLVRATR